MPSSDLVPQTALNSQEDEATESSSTEDESSHCPECDGPIVVDTARGERSCNDCGLVVDEGRIDHGPEWRSYGEDNRRRTGPRKTALLHDQGLSTNIDWQNRDAKGHMLSAEKRKKMSRLRKWDSKFSVKNTDERAIRQANGEVQRMGSALGLPNDIQEIAATIYRRCQMDGLLPGRSIEAMASASVYLAARQSGIPRTLDEIATVARVPYKTISSAQSYIRVELSLGVPPASPTDYIPRFFNDKKIPDSLKQTSMSLAQSVAESEYSSGRSPVSLAAASIYAAGIVEGRTVQQSVVSNAADVTEVTIRNRYPEVLAASPDVDLDEDDLEESNPSDLLRALHGNKYQYTVGQASEDEV